jgi:hypothetical protein
MSGRASFQVSDHSGLVDLAAAVPRPDELGDGFLSGGGQLVLPETLAAMQDDVSLDELVEDGFVGQYDAVLSVADPDDPLVELQQVRILVTQLADEAAAADWFEQASQPMDGWEDVDGSLEIGDETVQFEGEGTFNGRDYTGVAVRYRTGAFEIAQTIVNYVDRPGSGLSMDDDGLEEIADLVLDHLADIEDAPQTGLRVLHLGDGSTDYASLYDGYVVRDGDYLPLFGVPDEQAAWLQESTPGLVNAYLTQQSTGDGSDTTYIAFVYEFEDTRAARAFVDHHAESLADSSTFVGVEEVEAPAEYGDETIALEVDADRGEGAPHKGVRLVIRDGSMVAGLTLEGTTRRPPVSGLDDLAGLQESCLAEGRCVELGTL